MPAWNAVMSVWVICCSLGRYSWLALCLFVALFVGVCPLGAAEVIKFKTGVEFRKASEEAVGITWSDLSLREAIQSLARTQEICIWLDRRVDPDQPIQFTAR